MTEPDAPDEVSFSGPDDRFLYGPIYLLGAAITVTISIAIAVKASPAGVLAGLLAVPIVAVGIGELRLEFRAGPRASSSATISGATASPGTTSSRCGWRDCVEGSTR